jgi:hypothetical protein
MDLDELMAESNARARRGRLLARQMFGGVVFLLFVAVFLYIAAPEGPFALVEDPGPIAVALPVLGITGLVVGLAWMFRILRAKPEPDGKSWRYRSKL